jgi:hypothetical protein
MNPEPVPLAAVPSDPLSPPRNGNLDAGDDERKRQGKSMNAEGITTLFEM